MDIQEAVNAGHVLRIKVMRDGEYVVCVECMDIETSYLSNTDEDMDIGNLIQLGLETWRAPNLEKDMYEALKAVRAAAHPDAQVGAIVLPVDIMVDTAIKRYELENKGQTE